MPGRESEAAVQKADWIACVFAQLCHDTTRSWAYITFNVQDLIDDSVEQALQSRMKFRCCAPAGLRPGNTAAARHVMGGTCGVGQGRQLECRRPHRRRRHRRRCLAPAASVRILGSLLSHFSSGTVDPVCLLSWDSIC